MTTLILVRHGETDWNRDRRIQGTTDIPLNDTGRGHARDAALRIREMLDPGLPAAVVSSDLVRAQETAEIIAAEFALAAPRSYPGLRERAYGEAEGLSVDEYFARWGSWQGADVPGAEPPQTVRDRAVTTMRHVVADIRAQTAPAAASVVVVTHGALIREVLRHASAGEFPRPDERLENGSTHTLLIERERLRLLAYSAYAADAA